jgi:hypothetical protein
MILSRIQPSSLSVILFRNTSLRKGKSKFAFFALLYQWQWQWQWQQYLFFFIQPGQFLMPIFLNPLPSPLYRQYTPIHIRHCKRMIILSTKCYTDCVVMLRSFATATPNAPTQPQLSPINTKPFNPTNSISSDEQEAQISAFAARSGLDFSKDILSMALTHKSYNSNPIEISHERLQLLGKSHSVLKGDIFIISIIGEKVVGFYVTEYLVSKYPKLPAEALESVIDSYVGVKALASIGRTMGVNYVMRWKVSYLNMYFYIYIF